MNRKRKTWWQHISRIENKGVEAFKAGIEESENPYEGGYRNQNGPGGSLQKQRRAAWHRGWMLGKAESLEESGRVEYGQFVMIEGERALVEVVRECDDRPGTFNELNWIDTKRLTVIPKLPF